MGVFTEKKAVRSLEEDLWQLRKRVDQLESQSKIGKLEAAEVYDKTLRLMQRMAKRYSVDMADAAPPENEPTNSGNSIGSDPISKSIMLRRARQPRTE